MNLTLNCDFVSPFINETELENLMNEANSARATLLSRTGVGSEFTGWLDLDDSVTTDMDEIKNTARQICDDSDVLVVIGIGGSYLGARAALEFVNSPNYNLLRKDTPEIYFAGNHMSPDAINEILAIIGNRDFSINVISKSGTTTEPAIAFRIFRERLEQKYGRRVAASRIYATTDKEHGALRRMAELKGYKAFVVPDNVGGRYSVFTPVGLLPLAVAGVDIDELITGARDALEYCKAAIKAENPALLYAALRNGIYRQGKKIEIFADFEPSLRYLGEWWKQLFGESEGKCGMGLYPASVDYSADLHSIGQYIQQGERTMLETFVTVKSSLTSITIPSDPDSGDELEYLAERSLLWANTQAQRAAAKAHYDGDVPNFTVTLPDRSPRSFGEAAAFFMFACAVSGYILGVNPFDQPGVEEYKRNMFCLLGKPGYTGAV